MALTLGIPRLKSCSHQTLYHMDATALVPTRPKFGVRAVRQPQCGNAHDPSICIRYNSRHDGVCALNIQRAPRARTEEWNSDRRMRLMMESLRLPTTRTC